MTDSELRELMRLSAEEGRRALFDEYCAYVYAIAAMKLKSCSSREDIEECVSDIFAEVYRVCCADNGYDGDLKGIISTIARRTAIDSFRKLSVRNSRSAALDDIEYELSSGEDIEDESDRTETQRILLDCVDRLGRPDSDIILQHYFSGRSSGQIGAFLKMTESAVQKRLQRARKKLRTLLEAAGIDGV